MHLAFDEDLPTGGFGPNAMLVSRSANGGATFGRPITLIRDTNPQIHNDKNSLTADPTDPRFAYAIWDRLGIERSAVLGLSMGGMTAFGLALDHASRVTRIVAADCRSDAPDFFRGMWAERQRVLAEKGMEAIADLTIPTWLTEGTRSRRPDLVERVRGMILATSPEGYVGATEALRGLNYKHRLHGIGCPACLVVGEADGPHPAEMRSMAGLIPGARLIEIEAAHLANLENPEAFNEAVAGFLKG